MLSPFSGWKKMNKVCICFRQQFQARKLVAMASLVAELNKRCTRKHKTDTIRWWLFVFWIVSFLTFLQFVFMNNSILMGTKYKRIFMENVLQKTKIQKMARKLHLEETEELFLTWFTQISCLWHGQASIQQRRFIGSSHLR